MVCTRLADGERGQRSRGRRVADNRQRQADRDAERQRRQLSSTCWRGIARQQRPARRPSAHPWAVVGGQRADALGLAARRLHQRGDLGD